MAVNQTSDRVRTELWSGLAFALIRGIGTVDGGIVRAAQMPVSAVDKSPESQRRSESYNASCKEGRTGNRWRLRISSNLIVPIAIVLAAIDGDRIAGTV